jgi:hypothetical protein
MSKLSLSHAWEETKAILARDGNLLGTVALALILLPEAIAGVIAPASELSGEQMPPWFGVITILVAFAGIIGQLAIIRLALGPATSVGEAIQHGAKRLFPGLAALLLFALPLALILFLLLFLFAGPAALEGLSGGVAADPRTGRALLIFVLIAFALSVRFQLAMPVTAGENVGPLAILRRSWHLTAGHYWRLLTFLLLSFIAAAVLLLTAQFVAGIFAKAVFGDVTPLSLSALVISLISGLVQAGFVIMLSTMLARIYAQLAGGGAAQASVPKSGI